MTVVELSAMLARLPVAVGTEVNQAIADGRILEVQRILTRVTGDSRLASEAVAALVRYWRTGR
jgi:hypothetical protein